MIHFLTIVLDGLPWLAHIYPQLEKLDFDWSWRVVEGVAANVKDTSWCKPLTPRLSEDGTTQYLDALAGYDPRVILYRKELWNGKVAMVNEPLRTMYEPGLLFEMDSDELWSAEQIGKVHQMFLNDPKKNCAYFRCDYRVGPRVRITNADGEHYGNHHAYEWKRVWRFSPGMRFKTHEPPVIENFQENAIKHEETARLGLVFVHQAYSTEKQIAFKEAYYPSCKGALEGWRKLQRNMRWPVDLKSFLPWVGEGVVVDRI